MLEPALRSLSQPLGSRLLQVQALVDDFAMVSHDSNILLASLRSTRDHVVEVHPHHSRIPKHDGDEDEVPDRRNGEEHAHCSDAVRGPERPQDPHDREHEHEADQEADVHGTDEVPLLATEDVAAPRTLVVHLDEAAVHPALQAPGAALPDHRSQTTEPAHRPLPTHPSEPTEVLSPVVGGLTLRLLLERSCV